MILAAVKISFPQHEHERIRRNRNSIKISREMDELFFLEDKNVKNARFKAAFRLSYITAYRIIGKCKE